MPDDENDFDAAESPDEVGDAEASDSWQVYFLSLADPANPGRDFDLVKVGITKNDVDRRISSR